MKIPFEELPNEVALLRQEIREMKKMLEILIAKPTESEYLNTNKAAAFLHTTAVALRQRMTREEIPHMRKGSRLYFKKSDLIAYLEKDRIATPAEIEESFMDAFKK